MNANIELPSVTGTKRIFILDDHPLTRHGITHLLESDPALKVCGEAETAPQALAAMTGMLPDLVLADITLPSKSGLEFIKDMKALHPDVPVLVLSMHDENIYAERALRAGARGYIMKTEGEQHLLEAVHQVLDGRPDTRHRNVAALEPLHRLAARQRVPDGDQSYDGPVCGQLGQFFGAAEALACAARFFGRGECRDVVVGVNGIDLHGLFSPSAVLAAVMAYITPRGEVSKRIPQNRYTAKGGR